MLLQNQYGVCGVFATANALLALKIEISIVDIQRISRATPEKGTSARGIMRAIEYYECHPSYYESTSEEAAWRWMMKWSRSTPIIVAVENRQHWATVIGQFNNQVIQVDPAVPDYRYENNVDVLGRKEFLPRWLWGGRFLAIRVTRG